MSAETPESLMRQARQALAQGNARQAKSYYLQALGLEPESPDCHYGLAATNFLLGDLEGAAYHFKEVIRLDPMRAAAHVNLGAVYNRLGRFEEAAQAILRGIQLDPKRAESHYNLGIVYRKLGQFEKAVQAYLEATHLKPDFYDAHYNLGNLLMELRRYAQAAHHYKLALEIKPDMEKARAGLQAAEQALQEETRVLAGTDTAHPTSGTAAGDEAAWQRTLDPQRDGATLVRLHQAVIEVENLCKDYCLHVEKVLQTGLEELSGRLLAPSEGRVGLEKVVDEFGLQVERLRQLQKNFQELMKRIRDVSSTLFPKS
ncbi:MAG: tetratricopeptide repeat protein [Gemmatales bacterium]|nr:tetratricopeptide repeat protein [Gemmatales bacterium]MDW8223062.1 tetratricopeptide repeat protein [Gemmatales bacterium]